MGGLSAQGRLKVTPSVNTILVPRKVVLQAAEGILPRLADHTSVLNDMHEHHEPVAFFLVHRILLIIIIRLGPKIAFEREFSLQDLACLVQDSRQVLHRVLHAHKRVPRQGRSGFLA